MTDRMQQGEISVTTEHIFPIIKRWLYSDKDIFLRELVSNASDAITKLARLSSLGEAQDVQEGRIDVIVNPKEKTLTVRDNGIGMRADEVERYLNQIALSGALEFIEKYEGESDGGGIIGHFGLGFYSAFMVASRVEVLTRSFDLSPAVLWSCTDAGRFEMQEGTREKFGTDVILHVTEEEAEYLDKARLAGILEKYCAFLSYPIYLTVEGEEDKDTAPINETTPLWMKNAADLSDEDYRTFYHKLFGYDTEPLFWVHLNADYPLNFKGILYFPRRMNRFDSLEGEVRLFYNRVFVADNITEVVPDYLLSLKGVLDCPELPLNVSRSFLQTSPYVNKLSSHIAKKVSDKISDLFRSERERYEGFCEDLRPFLEYGAVKDGKFFSRIREFVLFAASDGGYLTLTEYLANKAEKRVYYTTDPARQAQYVRLTEAQGHRVLCLDGVMDAQYISFLEREEEGLTFVRVDSDPDALKDGEAEENETLKNLFSKLLGETALEFVRLKDRETPALFVTEENARRFADMMQAYRAHTDGGDLPQMPRGERFCINLSSPAVEKIAQEADEKRAEILATQVYYAALIAARPLEKDELCAFLENNNRLITL